MTAKMKMNKKLTTATFLTRGMAAMSELTTSLRLGYREMSRSGRSARMTRSDRNADRLEELKPRDASDTITIRKSRRFQPFRRYASGVRTKPDVMARSRNSITNAVVTNRSETVMKVMKS